MKRKDRETTYIETAKWEGCDIPSIRYHIWKDSAFVQDGFSTRQGGVSRGIYESMNFSVKMGDSKENVEENFKRFLGAHHFTSPVMADQVHETRIRRVEVGDAGKNVFCDRDYEGVDGLVTNVAGITLVTTFADCVPLYFADEKKRAIGLAHSGWRGTMQEMAVHMVARMQEEYGCQPEDIKAAIGPSICVDCYEVSRELAEAFQQRFQTDEIVRKKGEHYYLDLWKANQLLLCKAGIPKKQIAMPDLCTCCNAKKLFSHRASQGKRGNLCAFFMIKEEIA